MEGTISIGLESRVILVPVVSSCIYHRVHSGLVFSRMKGITKCVNTKFLLVLLTLMGKATKISFTHLMKRLKWINLLTRQGTQLCWMVTVIILIHFSYPSLFKNIYGAGDEGVKMFCYDEKEGWKVFDSDLNKKVAWKSTPLTIENKLSIEHEKRVMMRLFSCSDGSATRSARVRKEILYAKWVLYDDEGLLHISNDSSNVEKELGSQIDNIIRHCDLPWKNAIGGLAMRFDFFKTASSETEFQGTSSKYYLNEIGYWPQQDDLLLDSKVHRGELQQLVSVLGVWIDHYVCNVTPYPA